MRLAPGILFLCIVSVLPAWSSDWRATRAEGDRYDLDKDNDRAMAAYVKAIGELPKNEVATRLELETMILTKKLKHDRFDEVSRKLDRLLDSINALQKEKKDTPAIILALSALHEECVGKRRQKVSRETRLLLLSMMEKISLRCLPGTLTYSCWTDMLGGYRDAGDAKLTLAFARRVAAHVKVADKKRKQFEWQLVAIEKACGEPLNFQKKVNRALGSDSYFEELAEASRGQMTTGDFAGADSTLSLLEKECVKRSDLSKGRMAVIEYERMKAAIMKDDFKQAVTRARKVMQLDQDRKSGLYKNALDALILSLERSGDSKQASQMREYKSRLKLAGSYDFLVEEEREATADSVRRRGR